MLMKCIYWGWSGAICGSMSSVSCGLVCGSTSMAFLSSISISPSICCETWSCVLVRIVNRRVRRRWKRGRGGGKENLDKMRKYENIHSSMKQPYISYARTIQDLSIILFRLGWSRHLSHNFFKLIQTKNMAGSFIPNDNTLRVIFNEALWE